MEYGWEYRLECESVYVSAWAYGWGYASESLWGSRLRCGSAWQSVYGSECELAYRLVCGSESLWESKLECGWEYGSACALAYESAYGLESLWECGSGYGSEWQ